MIAGILYYAAEQTAQAPDKNFLVAVKHHLKGVLQKTTEEDLDRLMIFKYGLSEGTVRHGHEEPQRRRYHERYLPYRMQRKGSGYAGENCLPESMKRIDRNVYLSQIGDIICLGCSLKVKRVGTADKTIN